MDVETLNILEFSRILEEVSALCLTQEGAEKLQSAGIATTVAEVQSLRDDVGTFVSLLDFQGENWPEADFPPLCGSLERCAPEGAVLDGLALKNIARYTHSAANWKKFLAGANVEGLAVWSRRVGDFSVLSDLLNRVLNIDGSIQENAVPSLGRLRGEIARSRLEIDQTARTWLKDGQKTELWQSDVPTERNGRTVLPLKSNFKGRVGAVVHEVSGSGATLFVEPYDLVEKNNQLTEAQEAWRAEVQRLLREWTGLVRQTLGGLRALVEVFSTLDTYLARARWGHAHRGSFPQLVQNGQPWKLLGARHPLLGKQAVPIDFEVGLGVWAVLVSGPNTGGKTVTLKTVGLFSILHQWGLPLPASPESQLPVWDGVFADIGDSQSLDQALSTFSGHLKRLALLMQKATPRTLLLFDELGSGTDPQEGGALAISLLDELVQRRVQVLATTHHGALKNYAFTHPGFKNAAVEFDETLDRPTYRILPDVPGASHALDIAERVGLPAHVVGRARTWLAGGEADVALVLKTLKEKQMELGEREKTLADREAVFLEKVRSTDLMKLRLAQRELELKTQGLSEMNRFVAESRRFFENMIREIREGQLSSEKIKETRAFLDRIEAEVQSQKKDVQERVQAVETSESGVSELPDEEVVLGVTVRLEPSGQKGTLERWLGKDKAVVRVGSVRLTVARSSLRGLAQALKRPLPTWTSEIQGDPVLSLDIRGKRLEQALQLVEKQLDLALLQGLREFSIIHGLGDGVLQKGVQDYLRDRREVQKFFFSHPEEGGFGKTTVQL
jgi:DNA mismatch repair protein MutS2